MAVTFNSFAQTLLTPLNDISIVKNDNALELSFAGGINSSQFNTLDIDFDNDADLIVFDRSSNTFSVFINESGSYVFEYDYAVTFPEGIENWVVFRDFDQDGLKDLFTSVPAGMKVYKQIQEEGSNFPSWQLFTDPLLAFGLSSVLNLQLNGTDIPAIEDLDSDGDLDIVVFDFASGNNMRMYRNNAVQEDRPDTLILRLETSQWGGLTECDCLDFQFGDEACGTNQRLEHVSGKAMLLTDLDADNDMDFLFGDEGCNNLSVFFNEGTPTDDLFTEFDINSFPPISTFDFIDFPAAFLEDVTFDGFPDLLISPNFRFSTVTGVDFEENVWMFEGSSTIGSFDNTPVNFLQEEMFDAGLQSYPALHDMDNDNDLDIFVGSDKGMVTILENTGESFVIVDEDFLFLSTQNFTYVRPQFEDINGDGLEDFIVSTATSPATSAEISYFLKEAGGTFDNEARSLNFSHFQLENPLVIPTDEEETPRILIGTFIGNIEEWRNEGTLENPDYVRFTDRFLDIIPNGLFGNLNLASADIDFDGQNDLITTDFSGSTNVYPNFSAQGKIAVSIQNNLIENNEGTRFGFISFPVIGDLFNSGKNQLVLGNNLGGLQLFEFSGEGIPTSPGENAENIIVFPNPLNGSRLRINSSASFVGKIVDLAGSIVIDDITVNAGITELEIANVLNDGLYILSSQDGRFQTRLVVNR
ncbi:MAG: T9SS type A sorting domain-containing protein [Bacteroidota bacterium]